MLIARSDSAGTSSSTGSLTTIALAGTAMDGCPRNIRGRSEVGSMSAAVVRRAMCAPPISNGWSPKVFEILTLIFVPPALVCTMRRRLWFRKFWRLPGRNGCGAVAQVPIHFLPTGLTSALAGFCAIAGMDSSPMRVQITVFAISLPMGPATQKCLAGMNTLDG